MILFLAKALFWLCAGGVIYTYVGYPILVWLAAAVRGPKIDREPWNSPISVVVIVHNEADWVWQKLDNILASDCADYIDEILVGSDGSMDGVEELLESYPDHRVRIVPFPEHRGRAACLNDLVPRCQSDIVVITDAQSAIDSGAISLLAEYFEDVRIGIVSGRVVIEEIGESTATSRWRKFSRSYEQFIVRAESRYRSVPGATASLHMIRKNIFLTIPRSAILDDHVLAMQLVMRGYRSAFEPAATATISVDPAPDSQRSVVGGVQLLRDHPQWLVPGHNPIWWEYVSHRVLPLFSPFALMLALFMNIALIGEPKYALTLAIQGAIYVMAFMGWYYEHLGRRSKLFAPSLMFIRLNLETAGALWRAVREGRVTSKLRSAA